MHGLQACSFKYITVAAFHIYASLVKMSLNGEVGGHALNSQGITLLLMENHGKIMELCFWISVGTLFILTLISPPLFLFWKCHMLFTSAAYIQVHFRLDFFMEANNMNSGSILFAIAVRLVWDGMCEQACLSLGWWPIEKVPKSSCWLIYR